MDRHRVDADPDHIFHFGADPYPDPDSDWHQNDADPHADPTQSFTHAEKWDKNFTFIQQYLRHSSLRHS